MSSTRHAEAGTPFRQERYASSAEYDRALMANLVAKRCSVLDNKSDRELIWHLQFLSHQPGGLKAVAAALLENFGAQLGTKAMLQIGKRAGQSYNAEEVRAIRKDLPKRIRQRFLLKGEAWFMDGICDARPLVAYEEMVTGVERRLEEADRQPTSYPVAAFAELCRKNAEDSGSCDGGTCSLEDEIRKLCLDPGYQLADGAPWYFPKLVSVFRDHLSRRIARLGAGAVVTALGSKVHETLDYTLHAKRLTLIEGEARIGKSFSARHKCELHPGQARFSEVPPGNDDTGFFRALARDIGLGSFQQYKAVEVRERVESVLLTGDILICLDEAHRLLPQVNFRNGFPKRIEWLLSMVNKGVPVCLISPPGFIERLIALSKNTGWNPAQFIGRLAHREELPNDVSLEDLTAVARSVLPEANKPTLRALAAYARTSARYLAAIEIVASRARYIAGRAGRDATTTQDVRTAMKESAIPSDSKVAAALRQGDKRTRRRRIADEMMPATRTGAAIGNDTEDGPIPVNRLTVAPTALLPSE